MPEITAKTPFLSQSLSPIPSMTLSGDPALVERALSLLVGCVDQLDVVPLDQLFSECPSAPLIILRETFDQVFLTKLDVFCEQNCLSWSQFHLDRGLGWLGPLIVPGGSANYRDLLVRRLCAADDPNLHQSLTALPANSPKCLPSPNELTWMLSTFLGLMTRWLRSPEEHAEDLLNIEIEADPRTLSLRRYPVLPLPEHAPARPPKSMETAVNPRCGIVLRTTAFDHHPSVPADLRTVQAHSTQMQHAFPTWQTFSTSLGSSFEGERSARNAAIGEAIERYCLNYLSGARPIRAAYNELSSYALDPEKLILFSPQLYAADGFPFVPFTRETLVYWVKGRSLTRRCPAWLPLSLVYPFWQAGNFPGQPLTHDPYFPGVAAGATPEQAIVAGIEEIVERDSLMVWWLNHQPLPSVSLTPDLEAHWLGRPTEMGQRAWAIYLHNEFALPVMAGVVENTIEQLFNIGFACRPDPVAATRKAWAEALTLQERSRDLNHLDSLLRREYRPSALKPWRADRAYLDDYRPDFHDVDNDLAQQQFFLDPRAVERIRPWVDTPAQLHFDELPKLKDRSLSTYQARIESCGYEIFHTDLTTPDVAQLGLSVARVIIPGLAPDFPAAFPHLGNGRIQNAPIHLGWRTQALPEAALNYCPIPHA